MGLGRSFQRTNIFPRLTVFENIQAAFLAHRGRGRNFWSRSERFYREETNALLLSIGIERQAKSEAGALSYGNQKQIELGLALASEPRVLLLDEPTAGMSASETHETMRLLERIAAEHGLTLLFTEHDMGVVFGIGFVPEDRRIFAELTVYENLLVGSRAAGRAGRWTIPAVSELFPVLRERRDQRGGYLSGGEQQMLTIARTLLGNPELLLLDEPSEGLAPLIVELLRQKIAELKAEGVTILLAEQAAEVAFSLADRVYALEKGTVRFEGPARQLSEDKALRDRLLAL